MSKSRARIRVRRVPSRGRYDREAVHSALDRALVGHVAFIENRQPYCIPMLIARVGDQLYVHGSRASRAMRTLAAGAPACVTVTSLDELVLARSVFNHSANYESAVVLGRFRVIEEDQERLLALEAFSEKLLPGRWREVRPPSAKELKATTILALPIEEASVKARSGPPSDDGSEDALGDAWAGVVPIHATYGSPVPSPGLRSGIPMPTSVRQLQG
jgi:uncharacterized protein